MSPDHWQARLLGIERELALIDSPLEREKICRAGLAACACGRNICLALFFFAI